jgi:hypothetical protein
MMPETHAGEKRDDKPEFREDESELEAEFLDEETDSPTSLPSDLTAAWGNELAAAVCEHCDWSYLLPVEATPERCPHCFETALNPLMAHVDHLPHHAPPESVLPFTVSEDALAQSIKAFARGIPFPPYDLRPDSLRTRLETLYLPKWLVDGAVTATWQAEVGFDYEVVSHQAQYEQVRSTWRSQEVIESRIRWEPRLGRLDRTYHNIPAPALEESSEIESKLGKYDLDPARPYQPETVTGTTVRLPSRSTADAWSEACPGFQATAAEECRRAASADHIRSYRWEPTFDSQHWTLLLLPAYSTYYLDDEKKPQPLLFHGQSGRVSGERRASLKRAQRTMWIIIVIAVTLFIVSLLGTVASVLAPGLLVIGLLGLITSLFVGLASLVPIIIVWRFNRTEAQKGNPSAAPNL